MGHFHGITPFEASVLIRVEGSERECVAGQMDGKAKRSARLLQSAPGPYVWV